MYGPESRTVISKCSMANCLICCLVAFPSCTNCAKGCLPMLNSSSIRSTPCQNACMSIGNPPLSKNLASNLLTEIWHHVLGKTLHPSHHSLLRHPPFPHS